MIDGISRRDRGGRRGIRVCVLRERGGIKAKSKRARYVERRGLQLKHFERERERVVGTRL